MRILIVKTAALGDVVRTGYMFPFLKKAWPQAHVTWFTSSHAIELLRFCPHLNVLTSSQTEVGSEYDWIISLEEEDLLPEVFARHIQRRGRISGCWRENGVWRYSADAAPWFDMSRISVYGREEADRRKKFNRRGHAEILGEMLGISIRYPCFWGSDVRGPRGCPGRRVKRIGLNLCAGGRWSSKRMYLPEARRLLSELSARDEYELTIFGGDDDVSYNASLMNGLALPRVSLRPPSNLGDFARDIRAMDAMICADTLALHLALSQMVPTVAFFAPTSAAEIDGWDITEKVWSTAPDYCSYRPQVDNSSITASVIFEALERLMTRLEMKKIACID